MPSAALIAEAGFPALATTSSGIAMAGGILDGERIGVERMFAIVAEIARRVPLPVSGDLESGYGPGPEQVAASVKRAIAAGMVGANIEDTDPVTRKLLDFDSSVARIRAGVAAANEAGLADFVLNAHNVMVSTGRPMPPLAELRRAGLRRLTLGGSLMLSSYGFARRVLQDLAKPDAVFDYAADGITHAGMSKLLQDFGEPV